MLKLFYSANYLTVIALNIMLTHSKYEVYFVIDDEDEEHDSEKVSFNPSKEPPNATE